MKIIAAFKIVPDDQDISVKPDRSLDYSKAKPTVSTYDLNAIEFATQMQDAHVSGLSVGSASIDDSKVRKNALARGLEELNIVADDALADADAYVTASALAGAARTLGDFDVMVFGDGSADNYAQQVGAQTAGLLGMPSVSGVVEATADGDALIVKRKTESVIETLRVPTPCVLSIDPEAALPRICTMKEILAAGKKPVNAISLADAGGKANPVVEVQEILAPKPAERKLVVLDSSDESAVGTFASALSQALQ